MATAQLYAERSSGHCSMSFEPNGKIVFSMLPKTVFFAEPKGQLKTRIWIEAYVKPSDLYDGIRIKTNTKIYDRNRRLMGRVTDAFNPMQLFEQIDSLIPINISGYIENACIDNSFIPENDLSNLLLAAGNNEKLSTFLPVLDKYQFKFTQENESYSSYLLVQPEFVTQSFEPRVLMVFYKEELIAIFHTRPIKVKQYDSIEMGSEYKMIYNSKFSEHTKSEMVEIYRKKLIKDSR
jgi:hypothetical protein